MPSNVLGIGDVKMSKTRLSFKDNVTIIAQCHIFFNRGSSQGAEALRKNIRQPWGTEGGWERIRKGSQEEAES